MRAILAFLVALGAIAQDVPGDARRGSQLFEQKRCVTCHSINGSGGSVAPDLARRPAVEYTPSLLASAMWNHAPAMWKAMSARGVPQPKLEPAEVADFFAYFYSLRYFDPPGDAARGKEVFFNRCSSCHGRQGGPAPPVSKWKASTDPVEWAQQMWNHTSGMTREAKKAGIEWPRLTVQQMTDLMVYVQNLPGALLEPPTLREGDPNAGKKLFESQGCTRCHTLGEATARGRIDLLRRTARFHTLTEFAVAMWNHGPQMHERAKETGSDILVFRGTEMSDLLAYLFQQRYFEERGNPGRGARVYKARNCGTCHESGPGPPLKGPLSTFSLTSAMWKHGPQMLEQLEKRGMRWPQFTNTEMADLISFLNRR